MSACLASARFLGGICALCALCFTMPELLRAQELALEWFHPRIWYNEHSTGGFHPGRNELSTLDNDGFVRVWNPADGTLLRSTGIHPKFVGAKRFYRARLSEDGTLLGYIASNDTIGVIDVAGQHKVFEQELRGARLSLVNLSPGKRWWMHNMYDKHFYLTHIHSGQRRILDSMDTFLNFSRDDLLVFGVHRRNGKVCAWNTETLELSHELAIRHRGFISYGCVLPEKDRVIIGEAVAGSLDHDFIKCAYLYEYASGTLLDSVELWKPEVLTLTDDEAYILLNPFNHFRTIIDVRNSFRTIQLPESYVSLHSTGQDGIYLGVSFTGIDYLKLPEAQVVKALHPYEYPAYAPFFGQDSSIYFWKLWDLYHWNGDAAPLDTVVFHFGNGPPAFNADRSVMARRLSGKSSYDPTREPYPADDTVQVRRVSDGAVLANITSEPGGSMQHIALSPDTRYLAFNRMGLYNLNTHDRGTSTLELYTVESGARIAQLQRGAATLPLFFSPDSRWLLAAYALEGGSTEVRLWDAATGRTEQYLPEIRQYTTAEFRPDGAYLAIADSAAIHLYRFDGDFAEKLGVLQGHTGGITDLVFAPDGHYLLSAARDSTLWRWELHRPGTGQRIHRGSAAIHHFAIAPDALRLIAASAEGHLMMYRLGDVLADVAAPAGGQDIPFALESVQPSAAGGELLLSIRARQAARIRCTISAADGRRLHDGSYACVPGVNPLRLTLPWPASGAYWCTLTAEGYSYTQGFVWPR